jgi:hypothetical protein
MWSSFSGNFYAPNERELQVGGLHRKGLQIPDHGHVRLPT